MDDGIYYSVTDGICFIKLNGCIQHEYSRRFGCLSRAVSADGTLRYVFDLTNATHLDSTALGIIAGLCSRSTDSDSHVIFSTNPDVDAIMRGVGFFEIFTISSDVAIHTQTLEQVPYCCCENHEATDIVIKAHTILSGLNDCNRSMFKEVIECFSSPPCS